MYGLWYIFFGFLALTVVGIIFIVFYYETEVGWWAHCIGVMLTIIGGLISLVLIFFCILNPITAHRDVVYYKELYPTYCMYAEQLKDTDSLGDFAQNTNYFNEIQKYNDWIAQAKTSKETYGCFSYYYKEDLSELQYIFISPRGSI